MFNISTSDGILLYYLWVKCPQIRSWKDYTSQNYRILFNFRLCWLCMIKKRREARSRTINNPRQLENFLLTWWWELETSEPGTMLWKGDQSPRVKKERKLTLRWKWESVFSGRHMDNVPEETLAISVMIQEPLETGGKVRDKRTIVFSCIPLEGKTDWRRGTKILNVRQ